MKRRDFITLLGGAVAWPLAARAQQPAMPVIGFLDPTSSDTFENRLRAFRQGLKDTGYVEGENVAITYRFAENQIDRLPELAADLVRRQVAVIATLANGALASKAATTTIPIVFLLAEDPVKVGLVTSLARPVGNLTGINFFSAELVAKRLGLLREVVPTATRVAVLVNPTGPNSETTSRDAQSAARATGLEIQVLNASTSREINLAFAGFVGERPDALFVDIDPFFTSRRFQLVNLAGDAEHPGGLRIDDQLKLRRLCDRQIRGLGAFEDAAGINADLTPRVPKIASVAHQPADFGKLAPRICGGNRVARRQIDQLETTAGEEGVDVDEKGVGPLAHKTRESQIDLTAGTGVEDVDFQSGGTSSRLRVSRRGLGIGAGRVDKHGNASGCGYPPHAVVPAALPPTQR